MVQFALLGQGQWYCGFFSLLHLSFVIFLGYLHAFRDTSMTSPRSSSWYCVSSNHELLGIRLHVIPDEDHANNVQLTGDPEITSHTGLLHP